ncbi:TPA: DotD/TraH family lipoprotein [Serratia marcescens]
MKRKMRFASILLIAGTITGCSTTSKQQEVDATQLVNEQIRQQAIKIKLAQDELYQAGAINRTTFNVPTVIYTDSQNLRIDWQGDAKELLRQLAKQRHLTFESRGLALPLPLNINVGNAPYYSVIGLIQQQIDYRGTIEERNGKLILNYASPKKDKRLLRGY